MNMMYIKYNGSKRRTLIKDGSTILEESKDLKTNNKKSSSIKNFESYKSLKENELDDEITNYFLTSIHKNYLKNKQFSR